MRKPFWKKRWFVGLLISVGVVVSLAVIIPWLVESQRRIDRAITELDDEPLEGSVWAGESGYATVKARKTERVTFEVGFNEQTGDPIERDAYVGFNIEWMEGACLWPHDMLMEVAWQDCTCRGLEPGDQYDPTTSACREEQAERQRKIDEIVKKRAEAYKPD